MKKNLTILQYKFIAIISIVLFVTSFTGCSSYQKGAFKNVPSENLTTYCSSEASSGKVAEEPSESSSNSTEYTVETSSAECLNASADNNPQELLSTSTESTNETAESLNPVDSYTKTEKHKKVAYLTFDDGPSKENTPKNLDTLQKYNIKATFFVLPHEGIDNIYRRIINEGHVIGNHSYSHEYKQVYSSVDAFRSDLLKAKAFMFDKFSYSTDLYRFPGGTMKRKAEIIDERKKILEEEGYKYFDWSVSDGDCDTGPNGKSPDILAKNVLNGIGRMEKIIVLMHDSADKKATVKALPIIIEGLKKKGYVFDVLTNY